MSKADEAKKILSKLEENVPDIVGSAIITTNGLMISSLLPSEANERMIAAMSAALLGVSKRVSQELFSGNFKSLMLEIDKGNMFLMGTGRVILVVLTKPEPNIGLVTLEMDSAGKDIEKLFE